MADTQTTSAPKLGKVHGRSGTYIYQGIITQEEYNSDLVGHRAVKQYDIMRRSDSTVRRTLLVCKLPIKSAPWDVVAASEEDQDQFVAAFVKRELMERNIKWKRHLSDALTMLDFGYANVEKTYELTEYEGKEMWGLKELGFRKQTSTFKWLTEDDQPGITQQLQGDRASIPAYKLNTYTYDQEGDNYEGISLLRYCYKDWRMKDQQTLINAIKNEKYALGIPVVTFASGTGEPEKEVARDLLRQMRANEEAYLEKPEGATIEMLDMKQGTTVDVLPTIKYHDRQIVASVLAQFLEFGQETGTQSLSEDATSMFEMALQSVADVIVEIDQDMIKQLCDLNFTDLPNGYPKLTVGKIGDDNITQLSDAIQKIASSYGLTATFETENAIRQVFKLPLLPDEYKDDFDEQRQMAKDTAANLALTGGSKEKDALPVEKKTEKLNPKDVKAARVVAASQRQRKIIVKMLDED